MNNEESLSELVKRLERLQELIPDTIEAAKSLPLEFGSLYTTTTPGELRIDMPYDLVQYRKLRESLKQEWQFISKNFHQNLGSWFSTLRHKKLNVVLSIELELSDKEAFCRRVKIDEVILPVYKMECK